VLGGVLLLAHSARAQEGLLRYEPPDVDRVYPAPAPDADTSAPKPTEPTAPDALSPAVQAPASTTPAATAPSPREAAQSVTTPPQTTLASDADDEEFGASARVRVTTPGVLRVEPSAARDLPGAFGDPLRIVDALPGVTPIASGVPYVYIRGAPPAAQGYVFDGIPLPQLFHGAFGPAVIHARTTGPMRFYAGVPPAQYGRRAGGLLLAEGFPPLGQFAAELELRLIDVNAWVDSPLGKGDVTASARIGYPKLAIGISQALGIVEDGTNFNYWDAQLRYRLPITKRDHIELVWLGSYDALTLPGIEDNEQVRTGATQLEFHRIEARIVHRLPRGEVAAALRGGFDSSAIGDTLGVRAVTFGPRVWSKLNLRGGHALQLGGDLFASTGNVDRQEGGLSSTLGSPEGNFQVRLPPIAEASARNQGGLFAQTNLITSERTKLELGARLDYWSVESNIDVAFDPRARFQAQATDDLALHAALGMAHQPTVFLLPLPGLGDVAVTDGLSRSVQSEVGAAYDLPESMTIEAQGFLHHYDRMLLPELVSDAVIPDDPPLSSALAYGVELFLKRDSKERVSGWISYTLGWAEADSGPLVIGKFSPDFDVRHVLNVVTSVRLPRGFVIGGRMQARSGRLIEQLNPRYAQRLPWFVRADARVGYMWKGRFANMLAYLEWLNITAAREYLDADCFFGQCTAQSAPPLSLPNLGIRAEL
jgi:hypothetical protein